MKYIFSGLSIGITVLLVNGILAFLREPRKAEAGTVRLPKFSLIIGEIGGIFFLTLAFFAVFADDACFAPLIFFAFSLLSSSLIIAYRNCRIFYDEEGFTVRNFFGFQRRYAYNQLTATSGSTRRLKLYVGKRKISVDELALGKKEFCNFARRRYQQLNQGKFLPTKEEKDIFKGNLVNPGEIIFCYVMLLALVVGLHIFLAVRFDTPPKPEELTYQTLSFSRHEYEGADLVLYVENEALPFRIDGFREVVKNPGDFLSALEGGERFEVGHILHEPDSGSHNQIESLADGEGRIYLTIEDAFAYSVKDAWMIQLMTGGFILLVLAYIAISIPIARHPEKYSRRVTRLFFQDWVFLKRGRENTPRRRR